MIDTRCKAARRKGARNPVPPAHLARLARWAELVALANQLGRAVEAAADDGAIAGHWRDTLGADVSELLADLFAAVPLE